MHGTDLLPGTVTFAVILKMGEWTLCPVLIVYLTQSYNA